MEQKTPQFFVPKFMFWHPGQCSWLDKDHIYVDNNGIACFLHGEGNWDHEDYYMERDDNIIPIPSIGIKDENGDDIYACHYVNIDGIIHKFDWDEYNAGWELYCLLEKDTNGKWQWDSADKMEEYINLETKQLYGSIIGNCFETIIDELINGDD
jgi:hypothetical protein